MIQEIEILSSIDYESQKRFLLNMVVLEKVNSLTINRLFDDSVKVLGSEFNRDYILLFISDDAPYMVRLLLQLKYSIL